MRIQQNPETGRSQREEKVSGSLVGSRLQEGDKIKGRVLFNENGAVRIKTADGQLIRGRLEGEVPLAQGQTVVLTVTQRTEEALYLSVGEEGEAPAVPMNPSEAALLAQEGDPGLLARVLNRLSLPVTPQNVDAMLRLLAEQPDMPPDRAAFITVNKISNEQAMLDAAQHLLEEHGTAGEMLLQLSAMLAPEKGKAPLNEAPFAQGGGLSARLETAATLGHSLLGEGTAPSPPLPDQTPSTTPAVPEQPLAALPDAVAEQEALSLPHLPRQEAQRSAMLGERQPGEESLPSTLTAQGAEVPAAKGEGGTPKEIALGGQRAEGQVNGREAQPPDKERTLLSQLARIPEFNKLGTARMRDFVSMLERATDEITGHLASKDPAGGIKRFIDKMFANVDQWEEETPSLLRRAREELFVRLSLVEEALRQTDMLADKPAVIEQTQKLMDHIKLLGEIEQFVCAQIPVQLGGEQKTCELYVYQNKKQGRRIDPENAKILLALDLSHMGRLQALVAINGKELSVQLEMEQPQWVDFARGQVAGLYGMLAESGYKLTAAKVGLIRQEASAANALNALREYERSKPQGFDLTV